MGKQTELPGSAYTFKNPDLLRTALTHPSCVPEEVGSPDNNQRLEFLGDAVLSMVIAEWLFETYPEEREGMMAKARAALAKGTRLAALASTIHLGDHLMFAGPTESLSERATETALEDAFEAVIGAIYLDGGLDAARSFIRTSFGDLKAAVNEAMLLDNPKGRLQEWAQASNPHQPPQYEVVDESGPPHARSFAVEVILDGKTIGTGAGHSKKIAEEQAALEALRSIRI